MLDEGHATPLIREGQQFLPSEETAAIKSKQPRLVAQRHMPKYFIGKLLVNDDNLGVQVRRHSGHSESVLGWIDLVIGVGDQCWYCAEHHRSNKDGHRWN